MKNKSMVNYVCGLMGLFGIFVVVTSSRENDIGQWLIHFIIGVLIICSAGLLHRILSK